MFNFSKYLNFQTLFENNLNPRMNSAKNLKMTQTAQIKTREVKKLFNFIKSKCFGIEIMFGKLMIQTIQVSKSGPLMVMKFKLKNVFRNQYHYLQLVAGNYKLKIIKDNQELLTLSDGREKWHNFFMCQFEPNYNARDLK